MLLLRGIVKIGYSDDERVRELLKKVLGKQLPDGGFICERVRSKDKYARSFPKACYKASICTLLLCAELVLNGYRLNKELKENLVGYFLKRNVFFKITEPDKLVLDGRAGWRPIDNFYPFEPMRIGLPPIICALSVLGYGNHPALEYGWRRMEQKQDEQGRLILEGTLAKQPFSVGRVGSPNKWLTLYRELAFIRRCK